jgi:hypothetical protein
MPLTFYNPWHSRSKAPPKKVLKRFIKKILKVRGNLPLKIQKQKETNHKI